MKAARAANTTKPPKYNQTLFRAAPLRSFKRFPSRPRPIESQRPHLQRRRLVLDVVGHLLVYAANAMGILGLRVIGQMR